VATGYDEGPVEHGGTITGHVRVTGEIPVLPPQPVFKQFDTCGSTITDERLVTGPSGAVRFAVVSLEGIKSGKPIAYDQPVKFDNEKCAFIPHVLSASLGQKLEIHNSDPFLHDAHAFLGSRTLFNVAIPKGRTATRSLVDAGLVHINCNVRHTWMHAYVYVADNPYHAVTDSAGQFRITDIPPGKYTLRVWHEMLGNSEREVTVEAGGSVAVDIELRATAAETP
jgi:plastocyanin